MTFNNDHITNDHITLEKCYHNPKLYGDTSWKRTTERRAASNRPFDRFPLFLPFRKNQPLSFHCHDLVARGQSFIATIQRDVNVHPKFSPVIRKISLFTMLLAFRRLFLSSPNKAAHLLPRIRDIVGWFTWEDLRDIELQDIRRNDRRKWPAETIWEWLVKHADTVMPSRILPIERCQFVVSFSKGQCIYSRLLLNWPHGTGGPLIA